MTRQNWSGGIDLDQGWRDGESPIALKPQGIVIHHTEIQSNFNQRAHEWCLARLRHWWVVHRFERGWADLGYHLAICPHGHVFEARSGGVVSPRQGAHSLGNNAIALGIALLGNYHHSLPSYGAMSALKKVVQGCCQLHNIHPQSQIPWNYLDVDKSSKSVMAPALVGHRDVRATQCPGDALYAAIKDLRAELAW